MIAARLGIDAEALTGEENLIEIGMESLMIMRLVNEWGRQGISVRYSELIEEPTLDGWWRQLSTAPSTGTEETAGKAD